MQRLVIAMKPAVFGVRCGQRTPDQNGSQMRVAAHRAGIAALATALVIARTKPGPTAELIRTAEHTEVGAGLDQNVAGRRITDARNGLQQMQLRLEPGQRLVNQCLSLADLTVQTIMLAQMRLQHKAVLLRQPGAERIAQGFPLGLHMPAQARENLLF